MANKMRIITENTTDREDTELTDFPISGTVDNLKFYSKSSEFTTTAYTLGSGVHTIYSKLPIAEKVSSVVLGRHTFPIGFQLRIYIYSSNDWDPLYLIHDSGLLTVTADEAGSDIIEWQDFLWGTVVWAEDSVSDELALQPNYVYWLDSLVMQSIKIELFVPDQEVSIGRLIVGDYIQPTYTTSYGHELSFVEGTKQYRKGGGTLRSTNVLPSRKLSFSLNTITESDREILQRGLRHVGLRKDLFISLFPEDSDLDKKLQYSGIMKLTKIPSMSEYAQMYYKSKYIMEEV